MSDSARLVESQASDCEGGGARPSSTALRTTANLKCTGCSRVGESTTAIYINHWFSIHGQGLFSLALGLLIVVLALRDYQIHTLSLGTHLGSRSSPGVVLSIAYQQRAQLSPDKKGEKRSWPWLPDPITPNRVARSKTTWRES